MPSVISYFTLIDVFVTVEQIQYYASADTVKKFLKGNNRG